MSPSVKNGWHDGRIRSEGQSPIQAKIGGLGEENNEKGRKRIGVYEYGKGPYFYTYSYTWILPGGVAAILPYSLPTEW